jgi:DNA-binding transcriptional regulator YiaG
MDANLQIKEFATLIGVTEDTVINWEIREIKPLRKEIQKRISEFLRGNFLKNT